MPIPKPTPSESENDFIKRCVMDDKMISEYTDIDQRLAVCRSSYETMESEKHESGDASK